MLRFYFLSHLLDVVRREILLEVKVRNLNVSRGSEEITEGIVEDNLTTVLRMLETLLGDILVNKLGNLGARDEIAVGKAKKSPQLRCHILLSVEAVVLSALLRLLTIRVILRILKLTDKLGQVLHIVTEGGKFGLNSFKRHYIFLTPLTFKSM
jgi:hypothetical protein